MMIGARSAFSNKFRFERRFNAQNTYAKESARSVTYLCTVTRLNANPAYFQIVPYRLMNHKLQMRNI